MNNDFLVRYEMNLIEETTKKVTDEVTVAVIVSIAKNLKGALPDEEIAKRTGLSLEVVNGL